MITESQLDQLFMIVRGVESLKVLTEDKDGREMEATHTFLEMINRQIWTLYYELHEELKGCGNGPLHLVKANSADESESTDETEGDEQ